MTHRINTRRAFGVSGSLAVLLATVAATPAMATTSNTVTAASFGSTAPSSLVHTKATPNPRMYVADPRMY